MSYRYKITVIFSFLFLIFSTDQLTKFWAVEKLMGKSPFIFLNGLFQFVYAENPGAFLGLGGAWPRELRFVVFALVVFFGLGCMLWYLVKRESLKINLFAYTFILAGGVGNLWDRVFHDDGHVIDFMLIEIWGPLRTGVFNIADIFIVIGVLMALFGEYLVKKSPARPKA
ncbi:MAG: signal peptidase II [Bdellovibrionota bacterium]